MDIEPGMPGNPIELTDPQMMRALAHQARIAIWTYLGLHGPATATECAEIAGLSPSACSYHLRTLAKYGFVEEDPDSAADGRQRPWRARLLAFSMTDSPDTPAATQVASRLLVENMRASAEEIRARYVARKSEYPADWQAAAGEVFSVAHVTPDELDRLRAQVLEVMAPYVRLEPARPGRRTAGQRVARPVPVVRARGDPVTAATGRLAAGWRSGPLAVRSFRLLCAGQFTSTIGDFCYAVALPWLVLSAHGGAILLGAVLACYGVPRTVLIPVGGVLADKVGPRTLMLAADAARCVLVAGLARAGGQAHRLAGRARPDRRAHRGRRGAVHPGVVRDHAVAARRGAAGGRERAVHRGRAGRVAARPGPRRRPGRRHRRVDRGLRRRRRVVRRVGADPAADPAAGRPRVHGRGSG